jgi:hypothetical protein
MRLAAMAEHRAAVARLPVPLRVLLELAVEASCWLALR